MEVFKATLPKTYFDQNISMSQEDVVTGTQSLNKTISKEEGKEKDSQYSFPKKDNFYCMMMMTNIHTHIFIYIHIYI